MSEPRRCGQCGTQIPVDSPQGVCPKCLIGVGLGGRTGFASGLGDDQAARTASHTSRFVPPKPTELAGHFPQLEILDLIGHGGMGAVYKARQRGLDRLVALKILPPDAAQDATFAERFSREARRLAKLNHPNIVAVHDSGEAGGLYYLLMEYVDGVNLREAIHTGELSAKEAMAIVPQICDALQYAHNVGVVHRDVKPENILLDKKGQVKIADFGLARLLGAAQENFTLTGPHQVMGTPKYMAPEQMEGSHEVDHRADIYSLGVVFYEMLTGELPLGRFAPPSKKVQIDIRLDDVVLRTLEKEPARRYQNASEIKTDVETIGGMSPLPPAMRRIYGYEYRSPRQLFGWPLVHIATGVNPQTGHPRVARGIVAIGNVAVGGLLGIGGCAVGPIALGGVGVGLYSFAGASLGLLAALGGGAVGVGCSLGGGAVGTLAFGGAAAGIFAYGGGVVGVHRYGAEVRDPDALALWTDMAGPLPGGVWLVLGFLAPLALLLVLLGLAAIFARESGAANAIDEGRKVLARPDRRHTSGSRTGCLIAVLLLVPMMVLFAGVMLFASWSWFSLRGVRSEPVVTPSNRSRSAGADFRPQAARFFSWEMQEAGPVVTNQFVQRLDLSNTQEREVNKAIQKAFRDYLELEAQFAQRETDEMGRVITTIRAFPAELTPVEDQLWTELDGVLEVSQQAQARQHLVVHSPGGLAGIAGAGFTPADFVRPGILGWGVHGCRIEIWRVATRFHWQVEGRGAWHSFAGPELPREYQRFWPEQETEDEVVEEAP